MFIPEKILNKGQSHLHKYMKLTKELNSVEKHIADTRRTTEELFGQIENLIGDYFKKDKSPHDYQYYFNDVDAKRNRTSFCRDVDPMQNIYETEELLKNIRTLTLDERASRIKESELGREIEKLLKD